MKNTKECCKTNNNKKTGFFSGILWGILPHSFCIAFIVFSVIGATAGALFFQKVLIIPYFFQFLIGFSFLLATISALIYLKRMDNLSITGAKNSWKYLAVLYGVTIMVNLLMFYVVFPITANIVVAKEDNFSDANISYIALAVDIPCSGHASLINSEVMKISGVKDVKFRMPNLFDITFDKSKVSVDNILSADIFKTFKATLK